MITTQQRNVALLVASCFFMENLDGTIVTTAAPRIGANLHVAATAIGLVITAYLITLAVFIPLGGWLVGRLGNRRVFLAAIAIFTFASLLCALSTNLEMLVAMRVLQGLGGAMMTPVGRIVAFANVDKRDLLRIMSFIVWPGLVAPVIAPLAGGLITTYTSWRWIFLVNIPLGVIAFTVAARLMPTTSPPARRRLDWTGLALTSGGLGGLTYSAHLLSGTNNGAITGLTALVSVLFIAAAIHHLLAASAPLLELRTFKIRTFRESQSGIGLYYLVVSSVPFLLPLLFQTVFGWSPIKSGALVIFVFIGNIAIKPATTFLVTRCGFRSVLIAATAGVGCSMFAIGQLRSTTPIEVIALVAMINGVARSVGFTAYMSLALSDIPEEQMRNANVLTATIQQLGAGLAIAAGAVSLHLGSSIDHSLYPHARPVMAFTIAFSLLGVIAFIDTIKAVRLPRDAGNSVRAEGLVEAPSPQPTAR